ncbi:sulfotransferase [Thiotrichales bacterium HSG1]|nr:sulfotransferase [Thiotrichales bacterium HSG1]
MQKYKWIFIIGCYNSGTTLLNSILRQHPDIAGLPNEGQFLTDVFVTPKSVGVPRLWAEKEALFRFSPDEKALEAERAKQDWIKLLDKPEAPYALEKSPTNTARTLWLERHFEQPYFIHIVRNGYVVAMGIDAKVKSVYVPNLLSKAAHQWSRSLEIVLEDAPKLTNFLEVRYEDFTANPVGIMDDICTFLDLPVLSSEQLLQNYIVHGVNSRIKNKNIERLNVMTKEQERIIYDQAGKLLDQYNY